MNTAFGLRDLDLESIKKTIANFQEIEKVILYGSRAKGNFKTNSDIDLTLVGDKLNSEIIGNLEFQLDDLLLPYTFDISIRSQISNSDLLEHINRVGKLIYEKTINNKQ